MKCGLVSISKDSTKQYRLSARSDTIYWHRCHEILARIFLQDGSRHDRSIFFWNEFHGLQFQTGQSSTVDPAVQKPIERILAFITKCGREIFRKHIEHFARADRLAFISLTKFVERTNKRL